MFQLVGVTHYFWLLAEEHLPVAKRAKANWVSNLSQLRIAFVCLNKSRNLRAGALIKLNPENFTVFSWWRAKFGLQVPTTLTKSVKVPLKPTSNLSGLKFPEWSKYQLGTPAEQLPKRASFMCGVRNLSCQPSTGNLVQKSQLVAHLQFWQTKRADWWSGTRKDKNLKLQFIYKAYLISQSKMAPSVLETALHSLSARVLKLFSTTLEKLAKMELTTAKSRCYQIKITTAITLLNGTT